MVAGSLKIVFVSGFCIIYGFLVCLEEAIMFFFVRIDNSQDVAELMEISEMAVTESE